MEIPAVVTDVSNGTRRIEVAIGNLGPDGAYLKTPRKFETGDRIRLTFKISSHPLPFDIGAEVRWLRDGTEGGVGVQFVDCPAYDRAAIDDFCQHRLEETRGPVTGP